MGLVVKALLFVLLVGYVVSPVDLVPGPIDDAILIVISIIASIGSSRVKKLKAANTTKKALDEQK